MRDKYLLFTGGSHCAASVKGPYTKTEAAAELEYFGRCYGDAPKAIKMLTKDEALAEISTGDVDDLTAR
jgi:hypothetical protein